MSAPSHAFRCAVARYWMGQEFHVSREAKYKRGVRSEDVSAAPLHGPGNDLICENPRTRYKPSEMAVIDERGNRVPRGRALSTPVINDDVLFVAPRLAYA